MEKKFKRDIQVLGDVFNFVEESCSSLKINNDLLFSVNFVIEELFTNMVKYNQSTSQSDISVGVEKQMGQLLIRLTDYDVDGFDITQAREVDTSATLEERGIGGLGIHLVKKMVDDIQYNYSNRQSTITLIKNLG